jgi:uncharacterized protein (TIGR02231 family)
VSDADKTIDVDLPITAVTAFEDRAEIVRSGEVTLPEGGGVLRVRGVSPLWSEARVTASLTADGAHVDDVKVEHRYESSSEPDDTRARERLEQLRVAQQQLKDAEQLHERAAERRTSMEHLLARFSKRSFSNLALEQPAPAHILEGYDAFAERLVALDEAHAEKREAVREAQRECDRLRGLLDAGNDREDRYVADVLVRVSASGQKATLRLAGVLPCGLWRPSHEAHLLEDGNVRWTTFATVWQRTGDAWDDVALELSTARPSAGAELPRLSEDRMYLREKTSVERKQVIVEHREEAVPKADLSGAAPGVYDGGEPRAFAPEGKVSIPSDGRPHRVALETFTTDARTDRIAMPELARQVFSRATLENRSGMPLLAGPVTLLKDGGYVGTGDVSYVGPGEEFDLSFGSDDRFVIGHERKRIEQDRLLGKDRVHFVTKVRVEYSGTGEETIEVRLRMPKSEVKQLKVVPSEDHCSEGVPRPDDHGVVALPVTVKAGPPRELSLGFYFDRSGDVVVPDPW